MRFSIKQGILVVCTRPLEGYRCTSIRQANLNNCQILGQIVSHAAYATAKDSLVICTNPIHVTSLRKVPSAVDK